MQGESNLDEDAPEIVRILREEERKGLLYSKKTQNDIKQESPKQLIKLNKKESKILNVTSHELRTPIAAIKGYIQMILKQKLGDINEEQKKSLEVVLRNTNRLDNLIQDLLDISRLDSGRMKFITKKTNIEKMINETIETVKHTAYKKKIQIKDSIEKDLPEIIIDHDRIKQVIINLINNSIKFSKNNSEISISIKQNDDYILFEIKDYGRGISKDKIDDIFEAFYQAKSEDKKLGGVGLGLAISRGIIVDRKSVV